ncbi:MAG TPA: nitroreductase family deazaflavin-dependent oxidoreductase [Gammaproteobacteria bacterium]|nr:nitroreductase family deazaflavin-dependent oxidoreductase [Gammaproteobacteria bacterium]|tara:strand:+ start:746 stop:1207 length:462 start_codon:yes stop_codon:yes gene_type:complete
MSDPIIEASATGWIAEHRDLYLKDPDKGHLWDSTFAGGPGPLPTLLLTTIGCKSGNESVMPLLYGKVDGGYAIIASKGGDPKHPGWYHNIRAQGEIKAQVASDVFQAKTRVAAGKEREAVWEQMVAMYPPFGDYQIKAGDRQIPVVILEPIRQ